MAGSATTQGKQLTFSPFEGHGEDDPDSCLSQLTCKKQNNLGFTWYSTIQINGRDRDPHYTSKMISVPTFCFPCRWKWIYWCNSYLYIKNTIMTILSAHIFIFFLPPPKPFLAIFPPSPGEGRGKTFSKNWISICITWFIIYAKTDLT